MHYSQASRMVCVMLSSCRKGSAKCLQNHKELASIADIFIFEAFMDMDMPGLTKGVVCCTRYIIVYQGFEEAPVT